jgi:hypothetical protein
MPLDAALQKVKDLDSKKNSQLGEEVAEERPIHLCGGIKRRAGWLDRWREADEAKKKKLAELGGGAGVDMSNVTIFYDVTGDPKVDERARLYAKLLQEEVWDSARFRWEAVEGADTGSSAVAEGTTALRLGVDSSLSVKAVGSGAAHEAYRINIAPERVDITGASARGLLFGCGRLLREMTMHYEEKYSSAMIQVCLLSAADPTIFSAPKENMRQHQIAFRPKTNTYDALSFKQMRREILELVVYNYM